MHFSKYQIRFTQIQVENVLNSQEQEDIIIKTRNRTHRNCKENRAEILEKHYIPSMANKVEKIVENCIVCKTKKYERHHAKPQIQVAPIPHHPDQFFHLHILLMAKDLVDKFSKYGRAKSIWSKASEHIRQPFGDIHDFLLPKTIGNHDGQR